MSDERDSYALKSAAKVTIEAPRISYKPPIPENYRPKIGVIGTGGISASHLDAYRTAGWTVSALWNRTRAKAEEKAAEFCPTASVVSDWRAIVDDAQIDVVDVTLHPEHRLEIMESALRAGKHVLSQKPFVADLQIGKHLADLADAHGCKLSVNQNGRWAPHMAFMREAVRTGNIGELLSAHASVHWDHSWTKGTPFDDIEDLLLYDFGIHWFDFMSSLFGDRIQGVVATAAHAKGQANKTPLLAQAIIEVDGGQASLSFDASVPVGARDTTTLCGTGGMIVADGPDLGDQQLRMTTPAGIAYPRLQGQWFNDGFRGAMGELLCAIEENREPQNSARANLKSLALMFAACESRKTGSAVAVTKI